MIPPPAPRRRRTSGPRTSPRRSPRPDRVGGPRTPRPRRPPSAGEVDRGDLAGLDPERGVEVERRGAGPDRQDVRLVGVAGVADVARDHLQARLAAEEPAPDPLDPAQGLGAVADVDPHLGVLGHQPDRRLAVARVQQLEERVHRVDGTHGPSVPGIIPAMPSELAPPLGPRPRDHVPEPRLVRGVPAAGARGAAGLARPDRGAARPVPRPRPARAPGRRAGGARGVRRRRSGRPRLRRERDRRRQRRPPLAPIRSPATSS